MSAYGSTHCRRYLIELVKDHDSSHLVQHRYVAGTRHLQQGMEATVSGGSEGSGVDKI